MNGIFDPQKRAIIAIIAAVTVMAMSLSLSIPLISLSLERREIGSDIIGLMGAMPAIAFLIASPFIPSLTRYFGTGCMLWSALVLSSVSIIALALSDNLIFIFALRLAIGFAIAILFLISETWLNQIADDKNRGRTVAIYISSMTCGFALGPVLINILGTEGAVPFIVSGLIISSAGIFFYFARDTFPNLSGHSQFSILTFVKIAPLICAAILLVAFFDGSILTLLPVYGVKNGMTENTAVLMSSLLLAGNIALQFPIGWLADRMQREKVILICGLIGLAGALLLPIVINIPILLWPMLVIWGGAVVGTYTLALVMMGQTFKGAELVTANAAAGVLWGLGSLIGPSSAGVAMEVIEPHGMPLSFAFICFLFVLIAAHQAHKIHKEKTSLRKA
ncbi:MAG: MFS transporter [Sneathiella sp.]|nr:MFS transporter [Sneathiella sp.]